MTVQSARVQQLVKGDDVTLKHQLVKDAALDAEFTRSEVKLAETDKVTFFYQLDDGNDLIGFEGVAAETYPTSRFNVSVPGVIAPTQDPVSPERGSKTFKSGQGLTVRAEIIRDFASEAPKKETLYLYKEVDVQERGFLDLPQSLILP